MLAACSGPKPMEVPTFRPQDAPIYSSAVLDPARLAGPWVQVASFAPGGQAPCGPGRVDIAAGQVDWTLCLPVGTRGGAGPMVAGKPGRFAVDDMADWWVLWVDGDYRTMVIGTPDGSFGFVLNRTAGLPADRLQAARDIASFNGYDLGDLAVF